MPTYDYQCDACGHEFELFQNISESPKRKCPACKRQKLRRLFGTGGALVFKGSGFYQTDYRSDTYKKAANADTGAASESTSSDSKSSDSKSSDSRSSESSAAAKSSETPSGKSKGSSKKDSS